MSKRHVITFVNRLEVVGFKEFLELIPKRVVVPYSYSCNTASIEMVRLSGPMYGELTSEFIPTETEMNVEKVVVHLFKAGKLVRHYLFLEDLLAEAKLIDVSNRDLRETLHKATERHAVNYGDSTHLVKIQRRLWMVANPDDFTIAMTGDENYNNIKYGLFCHSKDRTVVYSVHKGEPLTFHILGQN